MDTRNAIQRQAAKVAEHDRRRVEEKVEARRSRIAEGHKTVARLKEELAEAEQMLAEDIDLLAEAERELAEFDA